MSTETARTIRDVQDVHLDFHTAPELGVVLCPSEVQRWFTSTETVRTIRGRDHRTSGSTFTQLLGSVNRKTAGSPLYESGPEKGQDRAEPNDGERERERER